MMKALFRRIVVRNTIRLIDWAFSIQVPAGLISIQLSMSAELPGAGNRHPSVGQLQTMKPTDQPDPRLAANIYTDQDALPLQSSCEVARLRNG